MGSAFTPCCAAASPPPSMLGVHASSYRLPRRRLLQTRRHGRMRAAHLQGPAALECEFPALPGPRRCIRLEPLSTSHAHGCIRPPGTRGSRTLGSHVSSVPQGRRVHVRTRWRQESRSLALPPRCTRRVLCSRTLSDKKLGDGDVACGDICYGKSLLWVSEFSF